MSMRYRIIRGEKANYRAHYFRTQEARDAAARKYAEQDGETVLTELWDESHSQDELNEGWACDGAAQPYEAELAGLDFDPDPGERIPAHQIQPRDTVTVWAFESLDAFLTHRPPARDHRGTVESVTTHKVPGFTLVLLRMDDGKELVAVDTAVTKRHPKESA